MRKHNRRYYERIKYIIYIIHYIIVLGRVPKKLVSVRFLSPLERLADGVFPGWADGVFPGWVMECFLGG